MASLENFRLVVFRAVAEHLNFRKAAEELYLTQPAVSLQIKALEEDLGLQLFDRTGSRIALTEAGKTLLAYTRKVRSLLSQAAQELAALSNQHSGQLALGASTTIGQYILPRLLGDFRLENPRVQPTLTTGNTEQIVSALLDQRIDLGFIEGPAQNRNVKTERFLVDEIVLIVPMAHEWADRVTIDPDEIRTAPLLVRERGSGTRHVLETALARHKIKRSTLNVVMELDSTEAIKSAVEAGMGAGFVSRWALARDHRVGNSLKIIEIKGLPITRDLLIASTTGPEPAGLAQEFRRFISTAIHRRSTAGKP